MSGPPLSNSISAVNAAKHAILKNGIAQKIQYHKRQTYIQGGLSASFIALGGYGLFNVVDISYHSNPKLFALNAIIAFAGTFQSGLYWNAVDKHKGAIIEYNQLENELDNKVKLHETRKRELHKSHAANEADFVCVDEECRIFERVYYRNDFINTAYTRK